MVLEKGWPPRLVVKSSKIGDAKDASGWPSAPIGSKRADFFKSSMFGRVGERFSKSMRLLKRGDFLRVQSAGSRVHSQAFIGLVLHNASGQARLGITTTKRLGNAVKRNRVRRLVREAYRRGVMRIPDETDLVVVAKKRAVYLTSAELFRDLVVLGGQVRKITEKAQPCDG
jgi:ribonuclease P protein component